VPIGAERRKNDRKSGQKTEKSKEKRALKQKNSTNLQVFQKVVKVYF
jgi:hypothetical protein